MAKLKLPTVADNAVIDIQIHETFYRKLSVLLIALGQEKTQNDFANALKSLKEPKLPTDVYSLTVQVVCQLIYEIENGAKEQNKTKEVEVEVPDKPTES
jgi:hypothetical protein